MTVTVTVRPRKANAYETMLSFCFTVSCRVVSCHSFFICLFFIVRLPSPFVFSRATPPPKLNPIVDDCRALSAVSLFVSSACLLRSILISCFLCSMFALPAYTSCSCATATFVGRLVGGCCCQATRNGVPILIFSMIGLIFAAFRWPLQTHSQSTIALPMLAVAFACHSFFIPVSFPLSIVSDRRFLFHFLTLKFNSIQSNPIQFNPIQCSTVHSQQQ